MVGLNLAHHARETITDAVRMVQPGAAWRERVQRPSALRLRATALYTPHRHALARKRSIANPSSLSLRSSSVEIRLTVSVRCLPSRAEHTTSGTLECSARACTHVCVTAQPTIAAVDCVWCRAFANRGSAFAPFVGVVSFRRWRELHAVRARHGTDKAGASADDNEGTSAGSQTITVPRCRPPM
jgi:hypothetical protein